MYISQAVLPKQKVDPLPEAEFKQAWEGEKNFKLLKKYNDPRFGDINILKSSNNQVVMAIEKMVTNKNEVTEDIVYLKKRLQLNHPHLMKLLGYSCSINKELCSTSYVTKAFYEYPRTDIFKEIGEKSKAGQEVSHIDLTHMAYQLLEGLHHVHQKQLAHGDIRPHMIGFDKTINRYELLDRLKDPSLIEKYQTNLIASGKEIFVSPELYKKLKLKNKTTAMDYTKNDIFSLGLSLIFIGTGNSVQNIYLPDGEIRKCYLHEHVMKFDQKFDSDNPFICHLVKTLLQMRPEDRADTELLIENMPSYDEFKRSEEEGTLKLQLSDHHSQLVKSNLFPNGDRNMNTKTTITKMTHETSNYTQTLQYNNAAPIYNESKVINTPTKYQGGGNTNMQFYNAESYFDANGNKVIRRSYGSDNKNENTRGPPSPTPANSKVIKKRYVMREDGTVVEIDPNIDLNNEDIKKYFDSSHNKHTIAYYKDVDHAISSETMNRDKH